MKFLDGLSEDIRKNLLEQLRVLWTHTSTAIEGNTLTLGETAFILSEGLTINGKSLKDHRDIEGHARAVDLMYGLVKKDEIAATDLFDLHRLVISEKILDIYKPLGGWKRENNSVNVTLNNRLTAIEFSDHWEVPELMERWLQLLDAEIKTHKEPKEVLKSYARLHLSFVAIHPFWDGNGRIARLIANLPCLKAGYPPIIIEKEKRYDYIMALAEYTSTQGVPSRDTELVHEGECFDKFCSFCEQCWQCSLSLIEQALALQQKRDQRLAKAVSGKAVNSEQ
ncbi:MAG: Fic family protein [Syntrophobacteraceae bacterium]